LVGSAVDISQGLPLSLQGQCEHCNSNVVLKCESGRYKASNSLCTPVIFIFFTGGRDLLHPKELRETKQSLCSPLSKSECRSTALVNLIGLAKRFVPSLKYSWHIIVSSALQVSVVSLRGFLGRVGAVVS